MTLAAVIYDQLMGLTYFFYRAALGIGLLGLVFRDRVGVSNEFNVRLG